MSVLGADDGGESNLIYTWSTIGRVSFSDNGTNAAQNTTVTFSKAGSYTLLAIITDAGGLSTSSTVLVTVSQTLTAITVRPDNPVVDEGATHSLHAVAEDQFGNPLAVQPAFTWSLANGIGSVDGNGTYTAPSSSGSATVNASIGGISSNATITVVADALPVVVPVPAGSNDPHAAAASSAADARRTRVADTGAGPRSDASAQATHDAQDDADVGTAAGASTCTPVGTGSVAGSKPRQCKHPDQHLDCANPGPAARFRR